MSEENRPFHPPQAPPESQGQQNPWPQWSPEGGQQPPEQPLEKPSLTAGEILAGVINSPNQTMAYVAEAKPLKLGIWTYLGVTFFSAVVGMMTWRNLITPEEMDQLSAAFGGNAEAFSQVVATFAQFGSLVLGPLFFFLGAAVYNLLGELMGGRANGRGLLAGLGLAHLPAVLAPPVQLLAGLIPMGDFGPDLVSAAGLVVWIWIMVIQIMAIRHSLQISSGYAVAVYFLPLVVVSVVIGFFVASIIGLAVSAGLGAG